MYDIHPEKGLINHGNWNRIKKVMEKARRGEPVSTLFLGGSITQGCLSSKPNLCYAALVHKWWVEKFPESGITYLNMGIGGTSSQFGVARVKQHVLSHQPDFVLTEFAVNDDNTDFFMETYEGLIRCILKDVDRPALMLMNNVRFDDGVNAEEIHLKIAEHYDLPMVSMKSTIWPEIENNRLDAKLISSDMLHPNDLGHKMIADVIISFLEEVYSSVCENEKVAFYDTDVMGLVELPKAFTQNEYEKSVRIKKYNMEVGRVSLDGFLLDMDKKKEFLDIFSGGFTGRKKGDSISFTAVCTGLALQFRKTVSLPAPVALAVIDGDEEHPVILDANFDETWGDCLYIETLAKHLPYKEHTVKITIIEDHEEDKLPFYLVSLIASSPVK